MNSQKKLNERKGRRARRVRERIVGTALKPRLSVFRSNCYTSAQLIDDIAQKTIAAATSREEKKLKGKVSGAEYVGTIIAERAKKAGIQKVVFDRGPYKYHGRVKALLEAARKGGLEV